MRVFDIEQWLFINILIYVPFFCLLLNSCVCFIKLKRKQMHVFLIHNDKKERERERERENEKKSKHCSKRTTVHAYRDYYFRNRKVIAFYVLNVRSSSFYYYLNFLFLFKQSCLFTICFSFFLACNENQNKFI
jgi:hypothetical protein